MRCRSSLAIPAVHVASARDRNSSALPSRTALAVTQQTTGHFRLSACPATTKLAEKVFTGDSTLGQKPEKLSASSSSRQKGLIHGGVPAVQLQTRQPPQAAQPGVQRKAGGQQQNWGGCRVRVSFRRERRLERRQQPPPSTFAELQGLFFSGRYAQPAGAARCAAAQLCRP